MIPENLVDKTDYDVWGRHEDAESFVKIDREVMDSGTPILDIEEPLLRQDGQQRVLLTSKVPIRDESGQVTGLLGIYADITERKRDGDRAPEGQGGRRRRRPRQGRVPHDDEPRAPDAALADPLPARLAPVEP